MWDPDPVAFTLPVIGHPITWYGLLFTGGFFLGLLVILPKLREQLRWIGADEGRAQYLADLLTLYVVIGTVVGARLGEVLFYDLPRYLENPMEIFMVWKGGLASHGAVVGIAAALLLFRMRIRTEFPALTFGRIVDSVVIPTPLVGAFIRLGNFMNQEVLGTPSTVPWAITFGHPIDGSAPVPRHPVQLYEMTTYFALFALLYRLWGTPWFRTQPGRMSGLFFVALFSARFGLEFFKKSQSLWIAGSPLLMGQWLSLPLIAAGAFLLLRQKREA